MNDKMDMHSPDTVSENIERIAELFPGCVTETAEGLKIDFDQLKQELSDDIVDGSKERYRLDWPGKREAIVTANLPTTATLRPVREESVDFDNTENLYIEGDNLEVLKVLQESYLGKIKMIYIDPPYNTGKDFVYRDNFATDIADWKESEERDEIGNRLVVNPETAGRYHSAWLSMMYPRLKLARNLLTEDGVIFISIDEHEHSNIRKICDVIFGENNFIADFIRKTKSMTGDEKTGVNLQHEFVIVYSKNKSKVFLIGEEKLFKGYCNIDNDPRGEWTSGDPSAKSGGNSTYFEIVNPYTKKIDLPPKGRFWAFSKLTLGKYVNEGKIKFKKTHSNNERGFVFKRYKNELTSINDPVNTLFAIDNAFLNQVGTKELTNLLNGFFFDNPKPVRFIEKLLKYMVESQESIILDFFAGSSTTAHAVMQLNAEDGGNRKYIMVQLPEKTDEKSEAYKAGYKTITEIGKERIRRAAAQIKQNLALKASSDNSDLFSNNTQENNKKIKPDLGFRVYKLDSSNMKDVYYNPMKIEQGQLDMFENNIKEGRTDEDLVAQVMLDWGLPLSLPIEQKEFAGKKLYAVAGDSLYCCFDNGINEAFAREVAEDRPLRIVFRDSGFKDDTAKENVKQLLKQLSPETEMRVI